MHTSPHFRGEHDFISIRKLLENPSRDLFTRPPCIDIGRVKEVDAEIKRSSDDRTTLLLIKHPGMPAGYHFTEAHAPQTNSGDVQSGISEFHIFHIEILRLSRYL
ncbi:hypothetical protein D3C81_748570 [compost metagenome]